MKPSLSFVIPAFNEEGNLEGAIKTLLAAMGDSFASYEIILIDDGSTDKTPALADRLAANNSRIKVIHHQGNKGLGYGLREGFEAATQAYVMWCAGDNPMHEESFSEMFKEVGKTDIVTSYVANPGFRPWGRRLFSWAYAALFNMLFGLKLRYYNGFAIYKTEIVKQVKSPAQGFSLLAETLIVLLKSGHSYVEVPTNHHLRTHGQSHAFSFRNVCDIGSTLMRLISKIYFRRGQ